MPPQHATPFRRSASRARPAARASRRRRPSRSARIHLHLLPDGTILSFSDDDHPDYPTNGTRLGGKTRAFIVNVRENPTLVAWDEIPNVRTNLFCSGHAPLPDGRLLIAGGHDGVDGDGSAHTTIFDHTLPNPWDYTNPDMSKGRWYPTATSLANGEVLVLSGNIDGTEGTNALPEVCAELWDPATETWSTMASMQVPRLYHSTALLLPDGRVLSAGGGRPAATATTDNENAELFSPPYLFKGARPTVSSAPATVGYGETFFIGTPDAGIASVTLARLSSVTHAFNMNQRFNRLSFTAAAGGLQASAPANRNLAPPGHYMLFILNGNGVPSVAKIIQLL